MWLRSLLLGAIILTSSCFHESTDAVPQILSDSKNSVVKLRSTANGCTAFLLERGIYITASHCFIPDLEYEIVTHDGQTSSVTLLKRDLIRDMAIFTVSGIHKNVPVKMWDEGVSGMPRLGEKLLSVGFPGYYNQNFAFEEGRLLDFQISDGVSHILSRKISFPGESGGPVFSIRTGEVVGIVHGLAIKDVNLENNVKLHQDISFIGSWRDIRAMLE